MAKKNRNPSLFAEVLPLKLRKGDLKKIEIIEAAIQSLATDGLRNFTYQTVAAKCKLAIAHVAYHFPSLDDLLHAAIKYVYASLHAQLSDALSSECPPDKTLKIYINAHIDWLTINPRYPAAGLTLINLASGDKRFRSLQTELKEIGQKRIETLFEITAKAKRLKRTPKQIREMSYSLQSLLMGQIVFYETTDHTRSIDLLKESIYAHAIAIFGK
jgi:AcrR family transcriptional regulator